jgi:hypothetical protein
MEIATIKVWQVTDVEWFAAATAEDALKAFAEYAGDCYEELLEEFGEPEELSDAALDRLQFTDEDDGVSRSFREELAKRIADGGAFPQFFATSEY